MMKVSRVVSLFTALALAGAVLADPPAPSAQTLGGVEAILKKCTDVDPKAAARYQGMVKLVAEGVAEDTLAEVRKSEEYQQAYAEKAESLSTVSEQDVIKACTGASAGNPQSQQ